jgi:hypothetical protein
VVEEELEVIVLLQDMQLVQPPQYLSQLVLQAQLVGKAMIQYLVL